MIEISRRGQAALKSLPSSGKSERHSVDNPLSPEVSYYSVRGECAIIENIL